MNILVCLKMVSQARFTDSLRDSRTDRLSGGQLVMNPADSYALELALRLKDRRNDIFITVLTMAPQYADHILRTALAMGADAVVIARPYVTAVYGGDAEGVRLYTEKIGEELRDAMLMCGAASLKDIDRSMVRLPR